MEFTIPFASVVVALGRRLQERRTKVRLTVHRAFLLTAPGEPECYFLNVTNLSPQREVVVTHVWLETEPPLQVLTKPLPVRLKPDDPWETWAEIGDVPLGTTDVEFKARAQLSTDTVVKSRPRRGVPPAGFVPG